MKKAICKGVGDIEVVDAPEPELNENEALVEIKVCGLCHSDICPYIGKNLDLFAMPVVLGHEFGGFIKEIKGETDKFKVGDKVVVLPVISCGECHYCKMGQDQLCIGAGTQKEIKISNFGTQAREGGLAERVAVPFGNLFKLPDDFDMDLAGIIEPAAVAHNNTVDIDDSNIVVLGVGAIGALAIKFLKMKNNKVIAVGNTQGPLDLAKKMGADFTISGREKDVISKINDYLKGGLVDYVFLYYISDETLSFATDIIKKTGEIKFIALSEHHRYVKLDSYAMLTRSITMRGYMAYPRKDFEAALKLVIEKGVELNLKELVSAKFPLEKTKEAFDFKAKEHVAKVYVIN